MPLLIVLSCCCAFTCHVFPSDTSAAAHFAAASVCASAYSLSQTQAPVNKREKERARCRLRATRLHRYGRFSVFFSSSLIIFQEQRTSTVVFAGGDVSRSLRGMVASDRSRHTRLCRRSAGCCASRSHTGVGPHGTDMLCTKLERDSNSGMIVQPLSLSLVLNDSPGLTTVERTETDPLGGLHRRALAKGITRKAFFFNSHTGAARETHAHTHTRASPFNMPAMQTVCGDALSHESVRVRRTLYVTGTVTPRIPDPFVLGPMDSIVTTAIPITGVLVFAPHAETQKPKTNAATHTSDLYAAPSSSSFSSTSAPAVIQWDALQLALSRLLDYYPHLSGRLRVRADGTRMITALQDGAALLEAVCSQTLAELRAARPVANAPHRLSIFHLPADGNALLAPYDIASTDAISKNPVLSVQFTRFACGGVSLGIRILHTVTDASGFFLFARHLAEIYRAITARERHAHGAEMDLTSIQLASPPTIISYGTTGTLEERDPDAAAQSDAEARASPPPLFHARPPPAASAHAATTTAAPAPAPVCGRELFFSARDLEALKARAVATTSTEVHGARVVNKDGWVSTFEALTALLWQRTFIAREQLAKSAGGVDAGGEQATASYLTSVDVRPELQRCVADGRTVLPPNYFPNAVTMSIVTVPREVLAVEPLSSVATVLHNLVRYSEASTGTYWMRVAAWVSALADKTSVESDFEGGVMTSQWSKIDMYDGVCFVDGEPPVLVGTMFTPIHLVDGLGYILPDRQLVEQQPDCVGDRDTVHVPADVIGGRVVDNGGLTVYYALSEPVWALLEDDPNIAPFMVMEGGKANKQKEHVIK